MGLWVLESFDEGLDILLEAEEGAGLHVSAKAYTTVMQMAANAQRQKEVTFLLNRAQERGIEHTDGLLLQMMELANMVGDFTAVARLYEEMSHGAEAATAQENDEENTQEPALWVVEKDEEPFRADLARAMTLALRAHCEGGDVDRVRRIVQRKQAAGFAFEPEEWGYLSELTRRTNQDFGLGPNELARTVKREIEFLWFNLRGRLEMALVPFGTVEVLVLAFAILGLGSLVLGGIELFPQTSNVPDGWDF
jgi:hypothetical protein